MTNGNWSCFDCRTSVRRPTWRMVIYFRPWLFGATDAGNAKCPICKRLCRFIRPDTKVPRKRDDAGWATLRKAIQDARADQADVQWLTATREKHRIEKRIIELESRPKNDERNRLVNAVAQ